MEKDNWFYIKDLSHFVNSSRSLVFKYFGQSHETTDPSNPDMLSSIMDLSTDELKELDETLTYEECEAIVKSHARKQKNKKNEIRYCLNDKTLLKILEDMNSRLVSNILNTLVNKGVLDSAYDSDKNDFIFWVKDDQENNQKPETD